MIDAVGGTGGGATPPPPRSGRPPGRDTRERGANQQASDRRLFMQLQAFGGCAEPKALQAALERSQIEAVLYSDLHDPRGVGVLTFAEDPAFFATRQREILGAEPFAALTSQPELAILGRTS